MEQEQPERYLLLDDELQEAAGQEYLVSQNLPDESIADPNPQSDEAETSIDAADPYISSLTPAAEGSAEHFDSSTPDSERDWPDQLTKDDPFVPIPYAPVTQSEAIRRSGLAWSAGVAFFGSVAFTLFLGWLADLLLGTSPWGIVVGIVLGSIIGFLQFFRITSQIFARKDDGPEVRPLMSSNDDE